MHSEAPEVSGKDTSTYLSYRDAIFDASDETEPQLVRTLSGCLAFGHIFKNTLASHTLISPQQAHCYFYMDSYVLYYPHNPSDLRPNNSTLTLLLK